MHKRSWWSPTLQNKARHLHPAPRSLFGYGLSNVLNKVATPLQDHESSSIGCSWIPQTEKPKALKLAPDAFQLVPVHPYRLENTIPSDNSTRKSVLMGLDAGQPVILPNGRPKYADISFRDRHGEP